MTENHIVVRTVRRKFEGESEPVKMSDETDSIGSRPMRSHEVQVFGRVIGDHRVVFDLGSGAHAANAIAASTERHGGSTMQIFRHYIAGGEQLIADMGVSVSEQVSQLHFQHARLVRHVASLEQQLADLAQQVRELQLQLEAPPMRDPPDEAAKAEIKKYFADHHGETLYASDVACALSLDYDRVTQWLEELENDGQITIPAAESGSDDSSRQG